MENQSVTTNIAASQPGANHPDIQILAQTTIGANQNLQHDVQQPQPQQQLSHQLPTKQSQPPPQSNPSQSFVNYKQQSPTAAAADLPPQSSQSVGQQQQFPYPQPQFQLYPPPIKPLLAADDPPAGGPAPSSSVINVPTQANQKQGSQSSPQKTVITKVQLMDELNVFYWTKTKQIISQIAEKAKSSVESAITTLDPGMKDYLYSGGTVNIVVISETVCFVDQIRDAFQSVFGRATVKAAPCNPPHAIIDYPIRLACGFEEAGKVAQEKIKILRQDTSNVPQNQVVVVVQPTLVNINDNAKTKSNETPQDKSSANEWFATYCMLIDDPVLGVNMKCFSQFIPIDVEEVEDARSARHPDGFQNIQYGFTASLDEIMSYKLKIDPMSGFGDEYGYYWLRDWAGIYESQLVHTLSMILANSYRRKWNECTSVEAIS